MRLSLLLLMVVLSACAADDRSRIRIVGSDSEVNLVQQLAEAFTARRPDVAIAVTGGGSGTGLTALLQGSAEIATSSRPVTVRERVLMRRAGVDPVSHVFAADALAVVVHQDNPIDALDLDSIGRIFRGEVDRWSDLGGPDVPVVGYGRQPSSGTWAFFRSAVARGEYGTSIRQMSGSSQILEGIRRDPGGIGYVAVGYLAHASEDLRPLMLRLEDGTVLSPTDEGDIEGGRYPLMRPLFQVTDGPAQGAIADLIAFERGPEGARIAASLGFPAVPPAWLEAP